MTQLQPGAWSWVGRSGKEGKVERQESKLTAEEEGREGGQRREPGWVWRGGDR